MNNLKLHQAVNFFTKKSILAYKKAVSESFEVAGAAPLISEVAKMVDNPLALISIEEAADFALAKFNKLVVPYLDIEPISDIEVIDDFEFYLHDLIHEAMKPGSIKSFIERDEDSSTPSHEKYSLQEYLEEDIAEYLTSRKYDGGLNVYLEILSKKLDYSKISNKKDLLHEVNATLARDISLTSDHNQKIFLDKFKKFVLNSINQSNIIDFTEPSVEQEFLLISKKINSFYDKKHSSGQTSKMLPNDRVASLIRRWLTALKNDLKSLENEKISSDEEQDDMMY